MITLFFSVAYLFLLFGHRLLRKFTPPLQPQPVDAANPGKRGKTKKAISDGNVVSSYSYGGTNTARGNAEEDDEERKRMAAANACCTIM